MVDKIFERAEAEGRELTLEEVCWHVYYYLSLLNCENRFFYLLLFT
jgi:hypothetical protein